MRPFLLNIITLILPVSLIWIVNEPLKIERIEFVLNALITCAATFSGFTLAIIAILAGFTNSVIVKSLVGKGSMKEMCVRYCVSLLWGITLIICCIVYGCCIDSENTIDLWILVSGSSIALTYFVSFINSGWYLLRTITLAIDPPIQIDNTPSAPSDGYRI